MTPEEIKAEVTQTLINNGITDATVNVNANGNVQIETSDLYAGSRGMVSITYNYYNRDNSNNYGVTYIAGTAENGVPQIYGHANEENFNRMSNSIAVTYSSSAASGAENDAFVSNVKNALGLAPDYNIYCASSAGSISIVEEIKKDNGRFDIALFDPADSSGNPTTFVNMMLDPSSAELRQQMHDNGSIIYGYETPESAESAIRNDYIRLITEDGETAKPDALNVIVAINDGLPEHCIENGPAPEQLVSDGTMGRIAFGFDPSIETNNSVSDIGTKYFVLNSPEFIKGNFEGKEGEDGRYTFFSTIDGTDLAKNEAFINNYVNSIRSEVANTFIDIGQIDQLSSFENSPGPSNLASINSSGYELVKTNYNSVSQAANVMINNLNNTTCANKGISDYYNTSGTSAFPGSLNDSNAFLYGITGQLMGDMKTEVASIQQMLNNYATLDASLAAKASTLNYVTTPDYATSIDFSKLSVPEMDSKFTNLFSNKIQEGKVGSVSSSDIQAMLSPNGIIMSGLSNEIADAKSLGNSIQGLIDNTNIEGPAWTELKIHLNDYKLACNVRAQAANTLQQAYTEALTLVNNYIAPDSSLDDSRIPELQVRMRGIKQTISTLRQQANQVVYVTCYDSWDTNYEYGYEVATYPYKYLLDRIPALDAQYDALNAEVTKLQGLAGIMNDANAIVARAMAEVNSTYASAVGAINPAVVGPSVVSL